MGTQYQSVRQQNRKKIARENRKAKLWTHRIEITIVRMYERWMICELGVRTDDNVRRVVGVAPLC